ncbi:bacteriocin immunity protein [Photobacterium sp. GJ3]|uniref:bacteriocin immunity protein n=1 Tax=Photobacterium sp. GJ3 TaxID=2829502 RepID=UPI0020130701|nr:bacteriocin immunity protein [Photobacterium sp. GJ3]
MKTFDKNTFTDYNRSEFVEMLNIIYRADTSSEAELDKLVDHFEGISQHPYGSDLIYYPENPADATPEAITEIVQKWRRSQGLPGFKDQSVTAHNKTVEKLPQTAKHSSPLHVARCDVEQLFRRE